MPALRTVVVNIGWLGAAQAVDYLLRAAIGILVARYLGVEQYGAFAPSLSLALMGAVFVDLGLRITIVRRGSAMPPTLGNTLALAAGAKLVLVVAVYAGLLALAALFGPGGEELLLTAVLAGGVFLGSFMELLTATLQSRERMAAFGGLTVGFRIVLLLAVLAVVLTGGGVVAVAAGYAAANVLGALLAAAVALPLPRDLKSEKADAGGFFREAFQFGVIGVLTAVFMQADIVMIRLLHSRPESGLYAAAFRLVALLYAVPMVVQAAVVPRLYAYGKDRERLGAAYGVLFRWSMAVSAVISGVVAAVAPLVIELVFGREFAGAAPAFAVLALGLWLHQTYYVCADVLAALGRLAWRAGVMAAGVALNIGLNLFAIPAYGAIGAAWTTLVSELFVLALLLAALQRVLPIPLLRYSLPALAAGAVAGSALFFLGSYLPAIAVLLLAGAVAPAAMGVLLATGHLRLGDVVRAKG